MEFARWKIEGVPLNEVFPGQQGSKAPSQVNGFLQIQMRKEMGGKMGIGAQTVIAVCSGLMRWPGNGDQGCLSVSVSVFARMLTDGLVKDKMAGGEGGSGVCVSAWACHVVHVCVCGRVRMSDEVTVVRGNRADGVS